MKQHVHYTNGVVILLSLVFGIALSFFEHHLIYEISNDIVQIVMRLLKFVSLPMIFLALTSTISRLEEQHTFKQIFNKTLKYTLLTTIIAAIIAMSCYLTINPVQYSKIIQDPMIANSSPSNIREYLLNLIPNNLVNTFSENNVIAVVIAALMISLASLKLEKEQREIIHKTLDGFFALFMEIAQIIIKTLPYLIWAFIVLFVHDTKNNLAVESLFYYIATVMLANFIQAFITLPIFLKLKGISPIETMRGMYPALITAFFSKSSSATLPSTMHCAEHNLKVSKKVASISIPLCTTINMNACAGFIYITVLYVSQSYGMVFTTGDYVLWIALATIAAIGNAGVPMGCFFMTSAYLLNMNVPTYLMGVILPFYTILDMFETSINVWSDACVTRVVDKELST